MHNKKLFVDDERFPVDDTWDIARTFHEAICMLEKYQYDVVSLDHDLQCFYGNREMTGYDILNFLIERKINGGWFHLPSKIIVHSQHEAQAIKMRADIERYF